MERAAYRRSRKWNYLRLQARWDRCEVPIYYAATRGGFTPLLKVLLSSFCVNECRYCALRCGRRGVFRGRWGVDELVGVAYNLWLDGKIEGVFLSSSIDRDPDYVVEREVEVARRLREVGFTGYIHLRLMPGCSRDLISQAAKVSDRIGVNLEAPTDDVFSELCPDKGSYQGDLVQRLGWCCEEARRAWEVGGGYCEAGVDTQFVVGAAADTDREYLLAVDYLYNRLKLRRIYFSGFEPIKGTPLESRKPCPPWREYRLYQASFLIRDYGFSRGEVEELLDDSDNLPNKNPKLLYAERNKDLYPVDVASATREELLRVPYIGPRSVKKILKARGFRKELSIDDLRSLLGWRRFKKAAPYMKVKGSRLSLSST